MYYIDTPIGKVDFVDIITRLRKTFSSPRQCLEIPMNIIKILENRSYLLNQTKFGTSSIEETNFQHK